MTKYMKMLNQSLVFCLQVSRLSLGKHFVIVYEPFSSAWTFSMCIRFPSSTSKLQLYLMSMFVDLEWKDDFLHKCITLWLSEWGLYLSCTKHNVRRKAWKLIAMHFIEASYAWVLRHLVVAKDALNKSKGNHPYCWLSSTTLVYDAGTFIEQWTHTFY